MGPEILYFYPGLPSHLPPQGWGTTLSPKTVGHGDEMVMIFYVPGKSLQTFKQGCVVICSTTWDSHSGFCVKNRALGDGRAVGCHGSRRPSVCHGPEHQKTPPLSFKQEQMRNQAWRPYPAQEANTV